MIDRASIRALFEAAQLGVISSINRQGRPESAAVGVTFLEDRLEFMVGTSDKSRKYHNIIANLHVSLVVWHKLETIQIEGCAKVLEHNTPEYLDYTEKIAKVHASKVRYANNPDQVWIVVQPNWIRSTDIGSKPWKVEEEVFNESR